MSNQEIKIKVKTLPEGTYELDILNSITIDQLKDRLQEVTQIQKARQRLIYRGRALLDTQTVQEAGVEDGHVLHLVERPDNAPPPTAGANNAEPNQQANQQTRTGRGGQRVTINQFNLGADQQPIQLGPGDDVGQVIGNLIQRLIPNANQGDVQIQMDNLQNFNLSGVGPDGQRPQIVTTINSYIDTLAGENPPTGLVPPLPVPLAINQRLSPTRRIQHLSRAIDTILRDQEVPEYLQTMIQQGLTYRHSRSRRTDPGTQPSTEAQAPADTQPAPSIPGAATGTSQPQTGTPQPQAGAQTQTTNPQTPSPNTNTINIDPQTLTQALNQALGGSGQSAVDVEMNLGQQQGEEGQQQGAPGAQGGQQQQESAQALYDQIINTVEQQMENEQGVPEQGGTEQQGTQQSGDNQNSQNQATQTGQQQQRSGRGRRQNLAYPYMPLITFAVSHLLNRTQNLVRDRFVPQLTTQIQTLQDLIPETDTQGQRVKENVHGLASILYNYSTLIFEMARLCSSLHRALEGHGDSIMENLTTVIRQDGSRPVVDTFRQDYQDTTIPIAATVTQNITMPSGDGQTEINLGQPRAGGNQQQPQPNTGAPGGNPQQQGGQQQGHQQPQGNRQAVNDVEQLVQTMMQNIDLGSGQFGNLGEAFNRQHQQAAGGVNVPPGSTHTFPPPPSANAFFPPNSSSTFFQAPGSTNPNPSTAQAPPNSQTTPPPNQQTAQSGSQPQQGQQGGQESRRGTGDGQQGRQSDQRGNRQRRPRRRRNSNTQTFNIPGEGNFDLGNLNIPGLNMESLPQEIQNLISGSGIQIVPEMTSVTVEAGDDFGDDFSQSDEEWEDVNEEFENQHPPQGQAQQTNSQQAQAQQRGPTTQQDSSTRPSTSNVSQNLFNTYSSMGNTVIQILESFFPAVINMVNRHGEQVGDARLQNLEPSQLSGLFDGFVSEVRTQLRDRQNEFEQQTRPYVEQHVNSPQEVIDAISRGLPFLERNVVGFINTYMGRQTQQQQQQQQSQEQPMSQEQPINQEQPVTQEQPMETDIKVQDPIPEVQKEDSSSSIPKATGGIGKLPKRGQSSKPKSGDKDQDKKAKIETQDNKDPKPRSPEDISNLMNAYMSSSQPGTSGQPQPQPTPGQQQSTPSPEQPQYQETSQKEKEEKDEKQQQEQEQKRQSSQNRSSSSQGQQQPQQPPNFGNLLNSFMPMLQNMGGGQQQGGGPMPGGAGGMNLGNLLNDPNIGNMVSSMMPQVQQMMGSGNIDLSGILGGMGRPPPGSGQQSRSYGQSTNSQPIVEEPSDEDDENDNSNEFESWMYQVDGQENRNRWRDTIQSDRRQMNRDEYKQPREFSEAYMKGYGKPKPKDTL